MKFLRRDSNRHSKLGRKRKKKQIWRKPKGRDNKMREKRKGYPAVVSIGYKKESKENLILVNNIEDLKKVSKDKKIILSKIGKKKKIEIAKKAKEMKIEFENLNIEKFLKSVEKKKVKPKEKVEVKKEKPKEEKK